MSLHDYAKKHKMKDYDKSFKMIRNIKEEPGLLNQSKKEPSEKPSADDISRTYTCEICNFETKYNFNLVAHYKTLKHITNAKSKGEIKETLTNLVARIFLDFFFHYLKNLVSNVL